MTVECTLLRFALREALLRRCARGPTPPSLFWTVSDSYWIAILISFSCSVVGPFTVVCSSSVNGAESVLDVTCSSNRLNTAFLNCSYDESSQTETCCKCTFYCTPLTWMFLPVTGEGSFQVDLKSFSPGEHSLRITATSEEEELDTAETILFVVLGNENYEQ